MLIVSQDKTCLININEISGLIVDYDCGSFCIYAFGHIRSFILGQYKTEERAKKILRKIMWKRKNRISIWNTVFYMPKE